MHDDAPSARAEAVVDDEGARSSTSAAEEAVRMPAPARRLTPWLLSLLVAQIGLFLVFYVQEIAGGLPPGLVQPATLVRIYNLSFASVTGGFLASWWAEFGHFDVLTPMTIIGSLFDLFAGGGRFALLLPNLALAVAATAAFGFAVLRVTGRIASVFAGIGLLGLLSGPWQPDIGMFYVNANWLAAAAFGTAICLLMMPDGFRGYGAGAKRVGPNVWALAVLGLVVLATNLGAFGCLLAAAGSRLLLLPSAKPVSWRRHGWGGLFLIAAVALLFVAPANSAYLPGLAVDAGDDTWTHLSAALDKALGPKFLLAGVAIGLALALGLWRRRHTVRGAAFLPVRTEVGAAAVLALFLILVQLLRPSLDPIGIGLLDIPAALLVVLAVSRLFMQANPGNANALSIGLLALGTASQLSAAAFSPLSLQPAERLSYNLAASWIIRNAENLKQATPTILLSPPYERFNTASLNAAAYEQLGVPMAFAVQSAYPIPAARSALPPPDYAVVMATMQGGAISKAAAAKPLIDMLGKTMFERVRIPSGGMALEVMNKPTIELTGVSGGWLRATGTGLSFNPEEIPGGVIQLTGPDGYIRYVPEPPKVTVVATDEKGDEVPLSARFERHDGLYTISIDLSALPRSTTGSVYARIDFDKFFVPKDVGMNPDTRRLTVLAPTYVGLALAK